jgi:hypothetical protein
MRSALSMAICSSLPILLLMTVACSDKATPQFERCTQLESGGDLKGAIEACKAASEIAPTSHDGIAAAEKATAIQEAISASSAAERAKEWEKTTAQTAEKNAVEAGALASAQRIVELRPATPSDEVHFKNSANYCQGKGKSHTCYDRQTNKPAFDDGGLKRECAILAGANSCIRYLETAIFCCERR